MNDTASSSPAVELRGIRKRFGSRIILDGIDLTIRRGEVLVLVGPSGSGKSTLLKMVSGIDSPDEGQVWLAGNDVTAVPPHRRPVHTVFQNYALFPHLDVAGNVAFPLAVAGMPRAKRGALVETALGWVQMQPHARRRVDTLSGGERQRVALARALVDQPQCVLLDEPLSALDPHLRTATLELLQEIQSRLQVTYLYITHDREEALRIGHRIGVLNHGRLEQLGTPEEVYRHPATPFVASFLGRINWLSAAAVSAVGNALRGVPGVANGVSVGIRPEDLRITDDGPLAARVAGRQFCGDSTHLRLLLADGTSLVVDQRSPTEVAPGDSVRLGWLPESLHVFPAGKEEAAMNHTRSGWLAVPAVAYLAVLFLAPTAMVLAYSVCQRDFTGGVHWRLSGEAWRQATDATTLRVLGHTLLLAVGVTAANLLLAYPCAALLARLPQGRRTFLVLLISFPLLTSLLLRTYGWLTLLPLGWKGTWTAVGLVLTFNYLPFMLLPLVRAFERADRTLVLAAMDLGATPWQSFWRVTLPITASGAAAGAALVFIPVSGEYLIPHFIGDGKVHVVGTTVMQLFGERNWPYAAACATWLAAIVLTPLVVALVRRTKNQE